LQAYQIQAKAERGGQLDPQPVVVQSGGVLIGCPSLIAGKLPGTFGQSIQTS
jgi:hypothetical protein